MLIVLFIRFSVMYSFRLIGIFKNLFMEEYIRGEAQNRLRRIDQKVVATEGHLKHSQTTGWHYLCSTEVQFQLFWSASKKAIHGVQGPHCRVDQCSLRPPNHPGQLFLFRGKYNLVFDKPDGHFHLLKNICCFCLLVLKGSYHYWKYV